VTDAALVLAKLSTLREHTDRMDRRRPPNMEAFRADVDRQDALALSLVVAVQEATDIALHIASDEGWGVPSSYADSFELLARHGVIQPALAARMVGMTTLRNRVAHGYGSVDFERVWRETPGGVAALREFAGAIARHLGTLPGGVPHRSG
jgi:uncharacterized protein YutE (UPF0331/DUF86 family)